eukprot:4351360-Pleurochrysis_carterae.AAC.1
MASKGALYLPPELLGLVVAVQEPNGPRELVGRAVADGLAAESEEERVQQRDAGGPHRDQRVGPVARAR